MFKALKAALGIGNKKEDEELNKELDQEFKEDMNTTEENPERRIRLETLARDKAETGKAEVEAKKAEVETEKEELKESPEYKMLSLIHI